jgi:hypothetical protein
MSEYRYQLMICGENDPCQCFCRTPFKASPTTVLHVEDIPWKLQHGLDELQTLVDQIRGHCLVPANGIVPQRLKMAHDLQIALRTATKSMETILSLIPKCSPRKAENDRSS